MNSKNLQAIIRREVRKLITEVADFQDEPGTIGQDASQSEYKGGLRMLFSRIPHAPFQGDINALSNVQLSNESRLALKNWIRFASYALKKFGDPSQWPEKVSKISDSLSNKFEFQIGTKNDRGAPERI